MCEIIQMPGRAKKHKPDEARERLMEYCLADMRDDAVCGFADELVTARKIWHRYRALVESQEFPEPYRSALVKRYDCEPEECLNINDEIMRPDFEQSIIPMAKDTVDAWMQNGVGARILAEINSEDSVQSAS